MSETQATITPAPEREYHSVCPKCKGALTPVHSGSICLACADTLIFKPLEPVDERLSKRMVDNAAYPLATRTGLRLSKTEAAAANCYRDDVYAIGGELGLYVRVVRPEVVAFEVEARTDNHQLWVFVRWAESKALLDAIERVLDAQAAAVAESIGDDTSPEYKGKTKNPLSPGEET